MLLSDPYNARFFEPYPKYNKALCLYSQTGYMVDRQYENSCAELRLLKGTSSCSA